MGDVSHRALIVTGLGLLDGPSVADAHAEARRIFGVHIVTPLMEAPWNGFESFAVMPAGSKDGRAEFDEHESRCRQMVEWLRELSFGPGEGYPLSWVEIEWDRRDQGVPVLARVLSASDDGGAR